MIHWHDGPKTKSERVKHSYAKQQRRNRNDARTYNLGVNLELKKKNERENQVPSPLEIDANTCATARLDTIPDRPSRQLAHALRDGMSSCPLTVIGPIRRCNVLHPRVGQVPRHRQWPQKVRWGYPRTWYELGSPLDGQQQTQRGSSWRTRDSSLPSTTVDCRNSASCVRRLRRRRASPRRLRWWWCSWCEGWRRRIGVRGRTKLSRWTAMAMLVGRVDQ